MSSVIETAEDRLIDRSLPPTACFLSSPTMFLKVGRIRRGELLGWMKTRSSSNDLILNLLNAGINCYTRLRKCEKLPQNYHFDSLQNPYQDLSIVNRLITNVNSILIYVYMCRQREIFNCAKTFLLIRRYFKTIYNVKQTDMQ